MSTSPPATTAQRPAGRGRALLAALLAVCGGLAVAGGGAGRWALVEHRREVGGVPLVEVEAISGLELAPLTLPLGLAVAAVGLMMLALRGPARRVAAAAALAAGAGALAFAVAGFLAAPQGRPGAGLAFTVAGAVATVAGGLLAVLPGAPPSLPARYDLDADDDAAEEWRMASAEDDCDERAR